MSDLVPPGTSAPTQTAAPGGNDPGAALNAADAAAKASPTADCNVGPQQSCPLGEAKKDPKKTCTVKSETVATSPANRARTKIGVGEEVNLTVTPGPATKWTLAGGGKLSSDSGASTMFTAGETPGNVTITATCTDCTCSITFTVVEPSLRMEKKAGSSKEHTHGRPDCGWQGTPFLDPKDVNFYRVEAREVDSKCEATGSYAGFNGLWHGSYPAPDRAGPWGAVTGHTDAKGSEVGLEDHIYSGDPGARAAGASPPFHVGSFHYTIPWQWRVTGSATTHNFAALRQESTIATDGTCTTSKGGHSESAKYDDPTSP